MSEIIKPLMLDETGKAIAEALTQQNMTQNRIAEINAAADAAKAGIQEKTDEQVARIPEVTALAEDVSQLNGDLDKLNAGGLKLKDEVIEKDINNWLNDHPEATTTVQDKSLSIDKMIVGTLGYVTPEMFGAVGDGVTDDVEPLETALNYSITNHLELVLSKKYIVSRGIEIRGKNGIRIVGNAFGYYFDTETLPAIKCSESFNDGFLIKFNGCSDISIKGINFVGCAADRIIGIFIKDSSFSLIEDNNIIKFRKGIHLSYSGLNKIIRNTISICYCACDAIGSGDSQYTDNYINSCSFSDENDDPEMGTGIAIRAGSSHVNITGGKIEWNGKGIYIEGSSGINITSINFDYNKRGNIIVTGNSIDPDNTETAGLNINSNYFRSGGVAGNESHIYFGTNKGNIKANICGNTFVKASGNNTSDLIICPTAIIRHSSHISSTYQLNINVAGNMMLDGSTINTFWLDGVNATVNSHSNTTNKINYVINNELLIEDYNLRKTVISQTVNLTLDSANNIYIGSLNVDISNYKNGVVIPIGAVLPSDNRFCDYYVNYLNGTICVMSAKHNTASVSYCILYEQ